MNLRALMSDLITQGWRLTRGVRRDLWHARGSRGGMALAPSLRMTLLVSLAALLALLHLAPAAHADTLLYADHVAVYDGTGRQVGSAWPTSGGTDLLYVAFRLGSRPVIVRLAHDGFDSSFLRFASPDCAGQTLIDALEGELYRYTAVAGPRHTVYVQSGAVRVRTMASTRTSAGVCVNHEPVRDLTVPVRATDVNLADQFVPPFTTRARGRTAVPMVAP